MSYLIEIIGLGGGDINQLPLGIYKKLIQSKEKIFVRTNEYPVIEELKEEGVKFQSFDYIYEQENDFENIYQQIVEVLLNNAQKKSIIYAVPGHPMLAERTVQLLLNQKEEVPVNIIGGKSYLDDLFTLLEIDPIEGFQFVDATDFNHRELNYRNHMIFCQVYNSFIASDIKLALLEDLPVDYPITIVNAAGSYKETMQTISLQELDRYHNIGNLTSVYVPPVPKNLLNHTFNRLREIISVLRGPNGCQWDRAQTHESLREYAIEEVYELIDAIDLQDDEGMIEELGDVLLQVLLHSQIGEDQGYFTIDDVIYCITNKMINRHPHVFGNTCTNSIEDINLNWEQIKLKEKGGVRKSLLDGVPISLPALAKAQKLQKKAATVSFDWNDVKDVWLKLDEELDEVKQAINSGDQTEIEDEFGDVLFAIVNLARHYNINSEVALNRSNRKFTKRFQYIEKRLEVEEKNIQQATFQEMDKYWDEAKKRG